MTLNIRYGISLEEKNTTLINFTSGFDGYDCDDQTKKRVEASLKRGAVSLAGHTRGRLGQTAGNNGVAERNMKMEAEKNTQLNFE